MPLQVSITGLDRFGSMVDPTRLKAALGATATRAASMLRDEAKRMPPVSAARTGYGAKGIPVAPKYGGTMRQSIESRRLALLAAGVFVPVHYSGYVHYGTSKMPARPFLQWLLDDFGGLKALDELLESALNRVVTPGNGQ